jgi:hypothetical protein
MANICNFLYEAGTDITIAFPIQYPDGVHFDMRGWLVLARGWAWFLGAHA